MIEASTNNPKPMTYIEENTLQWQEGTYPVCIDTKNGEVFEYSKDAIVRYSDGVAYISLVGNNITEPTKDNSWARFDSLFGNSPQPSPEPIYVDVLVSGVLGYKELTAVAQISLKSEDVTLNKPAGTIKMAGTAISAHSAIRFKFINSCIKPSDVVIVSIDGTSILAQDGYEVRAIGNNGFATIILKSVVGYVQSEEVKINFRVIK